ncbi:putative aspartoacylase [Trichinella pseudospiralis]
MISSRLPCRHSVTALGYNYPNPSFQPVTLQAHPADLHCGKRFSSEEDADGQLSENPLNRCHLWSSLQHNLNRPHFCPSGCCRSL